MYFTKGLNPSEVGDVDIIAYEGRLHLFHLSLPSHDVVAHLASDDGIRWVPLPNALHVGDPGEFDDDQIWTMHTFRWEGRFYMLYTALCTANAGSVQTTGLAVSDDLVRWSKVAHNPVAAPDPRWYEADAGDCGRADWRDPFPWIEDGVIHGLICAHEPEGSYNRRGCVAHVTSRDALNWTVEPPFYTPRTSSDFEVPTLVKLADRYYLIGHLCAPCVDVWRVADSLAGPWRRPANDVLLPPMNCAFSPAVWRGRTVVMHWIQTTFDWDADATRGRAIAPPKVADALPDGTLVLRSFRPGWAAVAAGDAETAGPADAGFGGQWRVDGRAVRGACAPGMGLVRLTAAFADFVIEARVSCADAAAAGLFWRGDDEADACTRAAVIPGRKRIELHRLVRRVGWRGVIGRGHDTLQENYCEVEAGRAFDLRVVAYGPYVEVSVDDRVLLSQLTMSRRAGVIGLFVEDGEATFESIRVQELTAPEGFAVS